MKVLDLIRERKWDSIIILGLVSILTVLVSILSFTVPASAEKAVDQKIETSIRPLKEKVDSIYETQQKQIRLNGIAAYDKFRDLSGEELEEKLESSSQNAAAINLALQFPDIREILMVINRTQTEFFCNYFNIEI